MGPLEVVTPAEKSWQSFPVQETIRGVTWNPALPFPQGNWSPCFRSPLGIFQKAFEKFCSIYLKIGQKWGGGDKKPIRKIFHSILKIISSWVNQTRSRGTQVSLEGNFPVKTEAVLTAIRPHEQINLLTFSRAMFVFQNMLTTKKEIQSGVSNINKILIIQLRNITMSNVFHYSVMSSSRQKKISLRWKALNQGLEKWVRLVLKKLKDFSRPPLNLHNTQQFICALSKVSLPAAWNKFILPFMIFCLKVSL